MKIMTQYINKDALVAEIERLIEREKAERVLNPKTILAAKNYLLIEDYNKLLSFINTLEVKEVDLEKSISEWLFEGLPNDEEEIDYIKENAKHFFELGMAVSNKAQKGEL